MTTVPSGPADHHPVRAEDVPAPAEAGTAAAQAVQSTAPATGTIAEQPLHPATPTTGAAAAEQAPPARTIVLGAVGSALVALGGVGAAVVLMPDPVLNGTALSWLGYGHGKQIATAVLDAGLALLIWSWVRLGRDVLAGRAGGGAVLTAVIVWTAPLLLAPPLFSRDIFSYLAQGDLSLHGFDPYQFGVSVLKDHLSANVDPTWQNTHTPYGPLFVLVASCVVAVTGQHTVLGVVAMRLAMCTGLAMLCWALPKVAARLGGRAPVALWLGAANPLILVYLVGGGHNDLLMVGLLAAGVALVLDRAHVSGIALVTCAFAVKATAGIALPFLVWIWAARLSGRASTRFVRAGAASLAVVLPVFAAWTVAAEVDLGWLPALSGSSVVVEWLSVPTAAGQLAALVAGPFVHVDAGAYLSVARSIGWCVLAALVVRQWWRARPGEPVATVRALAVALAVVTLFSPATLPWYFSWALVVAAGLAWTGRGLVLAVFASVAIVLSTFPDGTTALYTWGYVPFALAAAALAGASLARPNPLRLSTVRTRDPVG